MEFVEYPSTDGLPMADNNVQAHTMHHSDYALREHFGYGADVYIATDTFVYFQQGDNGKRVASDVFVVLGVSGRSRNSYRIWEENGQAPDFVLEVLSLGTHLNDQEGKRREYARMGVREYFQYDPKGTTLARKTGHRLHGERPEAGRWVPLERQGAERIRSDVLGLELRVRRAETEPGYRELRYRDPLTGNDLPTHREAREQGGRRAHARKRDGVHARQLKRAWKQPNAETPSLEQCWQNSWVESDRAIQTARVENPGGTAPRALTQAPYPRGMALFGVGSGRSGIRCWTPVGHPEGRDNLDIRSLHHEYWRSRAWPCLLSPVRPCGGCSTPRVGEFDGTRRV